MEENISQLIEILKTWKPGKKVNYTGDEITIDEIKAVSFNIEETLKKLTEENIHELIFEKVYQLGYQAAYIKQQKTIDTLHRLLEFEQNR